MTKAKPIDRLELTRRKMAFREMMKHAHEIPAAPGVEAHPDPVPLDPHHCPVCGEELIKMLME